MFQDKLYINILTFCLFVCTIGVKGQDFFSGITVDAITNQPLPYVNIGILNKGIGTVSNVNGKFMLKISKEEHWAETIQFSSIGYETFSMLVRDLAFDKKSFPKVEMKAKIERLDGVVLTNKGRLKPFPEIVGYETDTREKIGFWNKELALGGELATKILVKKGPRKLLRLSITVIQKTADSVLVRINIYNGQSKLPQTNLLKDNILYTVKDVGVVNVDLEPYAIEVEDNFILSIELVEAYGTKIMPLVLLASDEEGQSYRRYASLDKWESIQKSAMAYVLDSDYYTLAKGKYKKKSARVVNLISGYVFKSGKGVSGIRIKNETTNKLVITDEKGKYTIEGDTNDMLRFYISENNSQRKKVDDNTLNITI